MNGFHVALGLLMVITGSINTLSVKWADKMKSPSTDGISRGFDHPFLQACGMFLGEMSCMVAYFVISWYKRRKAAHYGTDLPPAAPKYNPFIFFPPAMCDMTATSVQYIALTLTYASSFQMLRGAVIVFTGIFSKIFLRRVFPAFKWAGIFFVIVGLTMVGLCDLIYHTPGSHHNCTQQYADEQGYFDQYKDGANFNLNETSGAPDLAKYQPPMNLQKADSNGTKSDSDRMIGDILIVCAQVIVATQMVYEEKMVAKYNVPALQAVGWEGTFGFVTLSALMIPMYFIPVGERFGNNPRHVLEDAYDGIFQLVHNPMLLLAFMTTVFSIAFFNFAGISVTKEMSATTRMVLDSVRTMVIWGVSLGLGWQHFHSLQLGGFVVLVVGMAVYNDIIFGPAIRGILIRLGCMRDPYRELTEDDNSSTNSAENPNLPSSGNRPSRDPETNIFDPTDAVVN